MKNQSKAPVCLTIQDVAHRWQISVYSVRRLVWNDELKALRIGRSIRITEAEISRFESQH